MEHVFEVCRRKVGRNGKQDKKRQVGKKRRKSLLLVQLRQFLGAELGIAVAPVGTAVSSSCVVVLLLIPESVHLDSWKFESGVL